MTDTATLEAVEVARAKARGNRQPKAVAVPPAKPKDDPAVTARDLEWMAEVIGDEIGLAIKETVEPILKRIEELERRPMLHDAGIWAPSNSYSLGAGVSHQGSYWISQTEKNTSRPGEGSDWRLAVKRGRDAKREPSQ